jgi:hypothetical protein
VTSDIVEVTLDGDLGRIVLDAPPLGLREGIAVQIGARSDALSVVAVPGSRTVKATVRRVVPVGSAVEIEALIGERIITIRQVGSRLDAYRSGGDVFVEFPVGAAVFAK